MSDQLMHDIPGAQKQLGGMSRSSLYEEVRSGKLEVVKVGRRTYVTQKELERYVRRLAERADASAQVATG
ncbi:MAG TPA: helix-turn-helix domain-containing protein [Nocardioides sp.]|uniref:helix-turn-helix domain-containing protein n=1 Tax=uncultured Nocardioides sp. TaxID=198441 RepID=UPI0026209F78|nr:helix-turn-helix domain-containing protein [uncultured Nocardioides sp.]HRD60449.1 helix-turn-helix domain-containing protein [Nocardioides sp.]HRI94078.1 helix-turn-helix domain-containing protein [Nocardioides sp.]HRK44115.1 helix-turn-helix domain-containing protein [Nocardioides sp.]